MRRDRFERGQWFHGRIYTRRSDLSSDGTLLVYFASKFNANTINDREYTYAWTAISRPPWLTALALWPKGDCWWGGGMFTAKRALLLNHRPDEARPHPKHPAPGLKVEPNPEARGEDDPLYSRRLDRDGWQITQEWDVAWDPSRFAFHTRQPEIRARQHTHFPFAITMERRLEGLRYSETFALTGDITRPAPEQTEWMDWDSRGRVFALSRGRLLVAPMTLKGPEDFSVLEEFTFDKYEAREAPPDALVW